MNKKKQLPEPQKYKASDIEIKYPNYYAKFLQYLVTRETASWFDQVHAIVPKPKKNLSEIRLDLDATKYINSLETKVNAKWDELSEAIFHFINDPYSTAERENFQKLSKELYDISQTALEEINASYEFSGDIKSRLSAKVNSLVDSQISDLRKAIILQYQTAVGSYPDDPSIAQDMVEALAGAVDGPITSVGPLIVSGQTINDGRIDAALSIDDQIESYTFNNDDPVTDICTELNGRTFSKDDPDFYAYSPPLHYNCDSYWIINFKSYSDNPPIDDDKLVLTKVAQKQMSLSECCGHKLNESEHARFVFSLGRSGKTRTA